MSVSTEKLVPGLLPPKEQPEGCDVKDIDWVRILNSFDPSTLDEKALRELARRNPSYTLVGWDNRYTFRGKEYLIPPDPVQARLSLVQIGLQLDIRELATRSSYKAARTALIKAIGDKAALYYVQQEAARTSAAEMQKQREDVKRWEELSEKIRQKKAEDAEALAKRPYLTDLPWGYTWNRDWRSDEEFIPILSVKFKILRKAMGLTQRDFAKRIGYNINKYSLLEQGRLEELHSSLYFAFPMELLKKVIDLTHVNPYWLLDESGELVDFVDKNRTAMTVEDAQDTFHDEYAMFADAKVIRYWWSHYNGYYR